MKQRLLQPPNRRPEDTPPPPADLYVEPEEDLLVLGEMLHDAATMGEMLRELPFSKLAYRGNLRVVRGAAVRMADRCAKLLGEIASPKPEPMPAHREILDRAEASIKIDARGGPSTDIDEIQEARRVHQTTADSPNLIKAEDVQPPPDSGRHRKRPGIRPAKTGNGREYSLAETFILSTLRERGPMGTEQLVALVVAENSIIRTEAQDGLAALRRDKKVITSTVGRQIQNRVALAEAV